MKKMYGDYYLGLDMGTNSVGWAVTDTDYNILKFNGKAIWGVHLFPDAQTAAETRLHRSNRRRLDRRTWRIKLLQSLFAEEISKVDMGFFQRFAESNLHIEDKSANNRYKFSLFTPDYMSDKEYYQAYPTIYHLRKSQMAGNEKALDIRLLYMTMAHYIKYRGHFLFENLEVDIDNKQNEEDKRFSEACSEFISAVNEQILDEDDVIECDAINLKEIMRNRELNVTEKTTAIKKEIIAGKNKQLQELARLLAGGKIKINTLFALDKEVEPYSLSFKDDVWEEKYDELSTLLGEQFVILEKSKALYDLVILDELLQGQNSISAAKVSVYDEHQKDLRTLKKYLVENKLRDKYKQIFGVPQGKELNYSQYIGRCLTHTGKQAIMPSISDKSQDTFCKYLSDLLAVPNKLKSDNLPEDEKTLFIRIQDKKAFPKLRTKENGVIPMQLNVAEMKKILHSAEKVHPFLSVKDENGLSIADKIIQIMEFRIPYYIGPLAGTAKSKAAKRCWVVRKKGKITPWNFDEIVDKSQSAENFIKQMTNKCTYLYTEDVLPQSSLLYSEFMVRNELNNLSLNGERLSAEIIQKIIDDLMLTSKRALTKKKIAEYLCQENIISKADKDNLTGVDDKINSNLSSYMDFCRIFDRKYVVAHTQEIEDIIRWITLFGGEKRILATKIHEKYPHITEMQLKEIKKLNYNKWGRLSKTLLDSADVAYLDDSTGEYVTIIQVMRKNALNFMQLQTKGSKYGFAERIEAFNGNKPQLDKLSYKCVEELALSPAVKRSVWRTLELVQEITKIMGHAPQKIFLEMARGEAEKKRTKSRKNRLLKLYEDCKKTAPELFEQNIYNELCKQEDEALQGKRLFLYFTQMGRDMYTGDKIDLSEFSHRIGTEMAYDCDHIYPRSKTKDDSFDNLVLVNYKVNREKTDNYPLEGAIQSKMKALWTMLYKHELISKKKYDRLTRTTPLDADELAGFINRQLVETRQSTKAVANLLELFCGKNTKIVYSKAGNVSDFRHKFGFLKCREINDLHHAKDAYLNIVVGNVFDTKFTSAPYNFIKKGERYTLNPDKLYDWEIKRKGNIAWIPANKENGEDGTIAVVQKYMHKNNIQVTKMCYENHGAIYDATIYKAGDGKLFPRKKNLAVEKYGGYSSQKTAYFTLIEYETKKGKYERTLEPVYVHVANKITKNSNYLVEFLQENCQLKNVRVILPKIKLNSCLAINGCTYNITGFTGNQFSGSLATQFIVDSEKELYIRKVLQTVGRIKEAEKYKREIKIVGDISEEKNIELYDLFVAKLQTKAYVNRPSINAKNLIEKKEKFSNLKLEKQCIVLNEVLKLFECKALMADLSDIDGSKNSGKVVVSRNISSKNNAVLFNYSITGLFVQTIDLKAL